MMENHTNKLDALISFTSLRSHTHRDETTHKKIHRHLTDINDKITDEDIMNIDIYRVVSNVADVIISKGKTRKLAH